VSKILFWFRNDLRLHDNEALLKASEMGDVIPVYVFDVRQFNNHKLGFKRTGALRTQFLLESVADLKQSLQKIGSDLIIRVGRPERILADLAEDFECEAVVASKEIAQDETDVEIALSKKLKPQNIDLELVWGATLYHVRDLPFRVSYLPDVFTDFRKQVERGSKVRECVKQVKDLGYLPSSLELGEMPTPATFGFTEIPEADERAVLNFKGGETEALKRVEDYIWTKDLLKTYKETRNGMVGADYSSKFSAWLSLGCVSPRLIFDEVKRYERSRVSNDSTYWLIFELIWRDYFHFVTLKFGTRIFKPSGIKLDLNATWKRHEPTFKKWVEGNTGIPFIDANMRELALTGFMSNRGRQNVASFLVKDLGIDWTWGAAYFESQLLDYDVCSNWGNWNYVAGVGNDPRENRYFNIMTQAKNYDPNGEFVKLWCPELSDVPAQKVQAVGLLKREEQKQYDVTLGVDYPNPMINVDRWMK
jgi:deoxyribodipyrimidine photo-lyase